MSEIERIKKLIIDRVIKCEEAMKKELTEEMSELGKMVDKILIKLEEDE